MRLTSMYEWKTNIWLYRKDKVTFTIASLAIELTHQFSLLTIMLISWEKLWCLLPLQGWPKFTFTMELQLKQMKQLLLLPSWSMQTHMELMMYQTFVFLDLRMVIMVTLLELFHAVTVELIFRMLQHSTVHALHSQNLATPMLSLNRKIKLKKIDALMKLEKLWNQEEIPELMLLQSLLNQLPHLKTKWQHHTSLRDWDKSQVTTKFHLSWMKQRQESVALVKCGVMSIGTSLTL